MESGKMELDVNRIEPTPSRRSPIRRSNGRQASSFRQEASARNCQSLPILPLQRGAEELQAPLNRSSGLFTPVAPMSLATCV
jgi:hypothetical protein